MSSIKRYILLSLLLSITASAFECPEHCTCTPHTRYNHTKCSNLDGLRQVGKTVTIQSVDISNIGLTKLTNQLDKLINLTNLDLSDNQLSELPRLSKRIKSLNLSHNRITSGKLSRIPQYVQHLNLSYNDITYIPLEFRKLTHLKTLELTGNPINCTCDTLKVRNWLQNQHVWTDNHVVCSSPFKVKGKPWLQARQNELCLDAHETYNELMNYEDPNDNELMLGDQPIFGDGSGEENHPNDEIEKDFLQIIDDSGAKVKTVNVDDDTDGSGEDLPLEATTKGLELLDGSGNLKLTSSMERIALDSDLTTEANDYDDYGGVDEIDDDGSGSGSGILFVESNPKISITNDRSEVDDYDEEDDHTRSSLHIFGTGLNENAAEHEKKTEPKPVSEEIIIANVKDGHETEMLPEKDSVSIEKAQILTPIKSESDMSATPPPHPPTANLENSKTADTHESQGTMILLIILGVALVVLLAFLIFNRKKNDGRNRRDKEDVEATSGAELLDMDKNQLGKPVVKNGNGNMEFIPLMEKKDDFKPNNGNGVGDREDQKREAQEPLLKKLSEPETEAELPINFHDNENEKPIPQVETAKHEPVVEAERNNNSAELPKSPIPPYKRSTPSGGYKSPILHNGLSPHENGDDEVFHPPLASASPRPTRYSPVYSPETGRVKIKLTETPKPRTPMLVTRTRSNAGDIILTPQNSSVLMQDAQMTGSQ